MASHIYQAGISVNTKIYLDVLTTVVKPWMDGVAAGRPYIWQQDGAPAHNSKKAQEWCRNNHSSSMRRRSGLPAHLIVTLWTILCGVPLREMSTGPPQHKAVPDQLHQGGLQPHPHRGPQDGLQQVPLQARGDRCG
jgi:hypothetical protein